MFTDNRILLASSNMLKTMIGQNLQSVMHDEFIFTPTCYGAIYIIINKKVYILTDYYELKEFLGGKEEISVLRLKKYDEKPKPILEDTKLVTEEINQVITKITLVNTNSTVTNNTNLSDIDTLQDTHGIIFTLEDNYQIAFEKGGFGEIISIYRGYNLIKKFEDIPNDFVSTVSEGFTGTSKLELIEIE